jgi:hypothetical protein
MKPRVTRGGRLRAGILAACLITTGTAYAAATPGAQNSDAAGVTMATAKSTVRYGSKLRLSGRVAPGAPSRGVRLEWAPRGQGWRPAGRTRTGPDGAYRLAVRAWQSGAYRAVSDAGAASAGRKVTVIARLVGRSRHHVRRGSPLGVRGVLKPGLPGRRVGLQLHTRRGWKTVDRTRTGRRGHFRSAWRATRPGRFRLRVRFGGDRFNAAVSRTLSRPVYVYRPGNASWYGPGFYGHRTACGQTLSAGIKGVAHRSLPCGTRVTFRYRGRSVTARVIDRGPFHASRDWDLTPAVKGALGFGDAGVVWSTR